MAYAVFGDHMGSHTWSEPFLSMASAVECYKSWVLDRGRPESSEDHWSAYFEYGAHGERVSIVMEPGLLKEKLANASNWASVDIVWDHVVRRTKTRTTGKKTKTTIAKQPSSRSQRRLLLRKQATKPNDRAATQV
jgi:hypothetical protein